MEKFIKAYNELEKALRITKRGSVFEYEEELKEKMPEVAPKLKVCRAVRNYIQHLGKDFVYPSKEMTAFLVNLTDFVMSEVTRVEDVIKKIRPVSPGEDVILVAKRLERSDIIPVIENGKCVGCVTDKSIRKAVAAGKTKIDKFEKPVFTAKGTLVKDAPVGSIVLDGDKYLGVFFQ